MPADRTLEQFRIEKYGRFWKLMDGHELVAVIVYKKGAVEVKRRLDLKGDRYCQTSTA
jgi:hypothetical protein